MKSTLILTKFQILFCETVKVFELYLFMHLGSLQPGLSLSFGTSKLYVPIDLSVFSQKAGAFW